MIAAATLLTARQLGASAYGQYAGFVAASGMASVAFSLGLNTWLLREVARKPRSSRDLLGSALLIETLLGLPWILAVSLLMPKLDADAFPVSLMALIALAIWLDALFMAGLSALKGLMRSGTTALSLWLSRGLRLRGVALLAWQGHRIGVLYAGAAVVAGAVSILLIVGRPGFTIPRGWADSLGRVGSEVAPFAVSAVLIMVYMRADVTIVAITLDKQATGLYSSASSLMSALFFIPNAIYSVAIPALVAASHG